MYNEKSRGDEGHPRFTPTVGYPMQLCARLEGGTGHQHIGFEERKGEL